MKTYSTRSNAVQAARRAAKKSLGKNFEAYEGPDFEIHPQPEGVGYLGGDRFSFKLRGPAKDGAP